jgi:hypothetical protein
MGGKITVLLRQVPVYYIMHCHCPVPIMKIFKINKYHEFGLEKCGAL